MVIYDRSGAALLPYFNEKIMAGLGRGLAETGVLFPPGKAKALETFRRFRAILKESGIDDVRAVATAAIREAADGSAFCAEASEALGTQLRVLSGIEEGQISALGAMSGFRGARGLVADLGGASLELYPAGTGKDEHAGETYLLGPLARSEDRALAPDKRRKIIIRHLAESRLLPVSAGQLLAVGGAWRNVGNVHMALTNYPLRVVHDYRLDRDALRLVADAVAKSDGGDEDLKQQLQQISKRRFDTLPHAVLVLETLLEKSELDEVRLSSFGLREGVAQAETDQADGIGLLDTTELYFRLNRANVAFGEALFGFLGPVLDSVEQDLDVMRATCMMADAGARLHPDHRCDLIFQQVLRAPMPSLNHSERMFCAVAVAARYSFKFEVPDEIMRIMDKEDYSSARLVGTAMRLGGVFSGRSASILKTARLKRSDRCLILQIFERNREMISSTVKRRHQQLAELLGLEAKIEAIAET